MATARADVNTACQDTHTSEIQNRREIVPARGKADRRQRLALDHSVADTTKATVLCLGQYLMLDVGKVEISSLASADRCDVRKMANADGESLHDVVVNVHIVVSGPGVDLVDVEEGVEDGKGKRGIEDIPCLVIAKKVGRLGESWD